MYTSLPWDTVEGTKVEWEQRVMLRSVPLHMTLVRCMGKVDCSLKGILHNEACRLFTNRELL